MRPCYNGKDELSQSGTSITSTLLGIIIMVITTALTEVVHVAAIGESWDPYSSKLPCKVTLCSSLTELVTCCRSEEL